MNEMKLIPDTIKHTFSFCDARVGFVSQLLNRDFHNDFLRKQFALKATIGGANFASFKKACKLFLNQEEKKWEIYMTIEWSEFKNDVKSEINDLLDKNPFLKNLEELSKNCPRSCLGEQVFHLYSPDGRNFYMLDCVKIHGHSVAYKAHFSTEDVYGLDSCFRFKIGSSDYNPYYVSKEKHAQFQIINPLRTNFEGKYKTVRSFPEISNVNIKNFLLTRLMGEESPMIPLKFSWKLGGLFQQEDKFLLIRYKITNLWNQDTIEIFIKDGGWKKIDIQKVNKYSVQEIARIDLKENGNNYIAIAGSLSGSEGNILKSDRIFLFDNNNNAPHLFEDVTQTTDYSSIEIPREPPCVRITPVTYLEQEQQENINPNKIEFEI